MCYQNTSCNESLDEKEIFTLKKVCVFLFQRMKNESGERI